LKSPRALRILAPQIGFDLQLGGSRYDYEQISALVRLGHKVCVLLPRCKRSLGPTPPGAEVQWIQGKAFRHSMTWNLAFFPWLLRACLKFKPNILRVHTPYFLGLAGLAVGRLFKIPVLGHVYHLGDPIPGGPWVEEKLLPRFEALATISAATANSLRALHPRWRGILDWVHPGIDRRYSPGDPDHSSIRDMGWIPGEPLFLSVGALIARKNFSWLVKLMKEWRRHGRPGFLVIVGEGPDRNLLEGFVRREGLENCVRLCGRVGEETLLNLLRGATAFLFPSLMEGFGFAPAEALACGTPAIVSNLGSLPEVVRDGVTGYVRPVDKGMGPWLSAMEDLVNGQARRRDMGRAGVEDVRRRFDWDAAGERIAGIYGQAVDAYRLRGLGKCQLSPS
jgi:glycosyltransferase involved in cell wall biosynthesis